MGEGSASSPTRSSIESFRSGSPRAAPPPPGNDPDVVSLEVFPRAAILRAGAEQQLVARAKYSDGREEM